MPIFDKTPTIFILVLAWVASSVLAAQHGPRAEHAPVLLANGVQIAFSSLTGLKITSGSVGNDTILETPPTFLLASTGSTNISDSSGNFELISEATDSRTFRCGGTQATQTLQRFDKVNDSRVVLGGKLGSEGCAVDWKIVISSDGDDAGAVRLSASVTPAEGKGERVRAVSLRYKSGKKEQFYGLGSQPSFLGLRGVRVPVWSREGGVGRGDQPVTEYLNRNASLSGAFAGGSGLTTYTTIRSWTSTKGRWGILRGSRFAIIDLDSQNFGRTFTDTATPRATEPVLPSQQQGEGVVTITYDAPILSLDLGMSTTNKTDGKKKQVPALLQAVSAMTRITGRQPPLPSWTHSGAVLGIQGGQTKVETVVQEAASHRLPLAGVWLQDWCGTHLQPGAYNISVSRLWWNWEPDSQLYPTWADWVEHLNSTYGVRTLSYINTFLANVSSKPTGFKRNFYREAIEQRRFVLNQTVLNQTMGKEEIPWTITSGPGIDAGLLDLSKAETRHWFKDLVKEQIFSAKVSGAMQDFGEYLSVATDVHIASSGDMDRRELALVGDGEAEKPANFHNQYPLEWAKLLYEVSQELGLTEEVVGFHRSATTFSAPHTNLFWVGDQNINFARHDGLRSVIPAAIHMGFSGFGVTHSDIGGYTNTLSSSFNITRSKALLGRWGEVGAFTSALSRTHEGNIPTVNQQAYSDRDTWAYHRHNTKLFVALAPYRQKLLDAYYAHGWPLIRPSSLYAAYGSSDTETESGNWTFFLGDRLWISPIYDAVDDVNLGRQNVTIMLPKLNYAQGADVKYRHIWTN